MSEAENNVEAQYKVILKGRFGKKIASYDFPEQYARDWPQNAPIVWNTYKTDPASVNVERPTHKLIVLKNNKEIGTISATKNGGFKIKTTSYITDHLRALLGYDSNGNIKKGTVYNINDGTAAFQLKGNKTGLKFSPETDHAAATLEGFGITDSKAGAIYLQKRTTPQKQNEFVNALEHLLKDAPIQDNSSTSKSPVLPQKELVHSS